jgi:hypothetical protein
MPIEQYKIVAGWNNAVTLGNVESIVPSPAPAKYLNDIVELNNYDANTSYSVHSTPSLENRLFVPNGGVASGYIRIDWIFALITDDALKYWRSNYVGKMTIATKSDDVYDTMVNWNAILEKPQPTIEQRYFTCDVWVYENVVIPVYLVGAPS